ncbi:MAG: cytochrome c3 family protein [Desulfobacula sp.]|jgi:hypothetical protein
MNKKLLTWILAASISVIFVATGLNAGTKAADTIKMDTNAYTKRTKTPPKFEFAVFTHKKHIEEYKVSCGECHHDKDKKPLTLKAGDAVQKCSECHTVMEKDKANPKDIKALENAMHTNCIECHKQANIKAGDPKGLKGNAPVSCNNCHVPAKS